MRSKEFVSTLSTPLLQNTLRNQTNPKERLRYQPIVVYHLAEQAKAGGVDLSQAEGPWRVGTRALDRPGRNSLDSIPVVTNERTQIMVDTVGASAANVPTGRVVRADASNLSPMPTRNVPFITVTCSMPAWECGGMR
jgi:hypothetical protein